MATIQELRQKPHWSYSALNCYLGCSLQFYFRYIAQAEAEKTSVCFVFGKAFHSVLSIHANRLKDGKDGLTEPELADAFVEYFKAEATDVPNLSYKSGEDFDSSVSLGQRMLKATLENWREEKIISVSEAFEITVPGIEKPFIGEYDMVVEGYDCRQIVDWKTSSCRWSTGKSDRDLQATVFTYAYTQIHQQRPAFRFDVVTKAKTPSVESHHTVRNAGDFQRFIAIANAVQRGVNKGVFIPSEPIFGCGDCPYQKQCKSWR